MIGASPKTEQEGNAKEPVLANVMTAFGYLYDQAQAADVNAQEEAAVFTLRPNSTEYPQVNIIDFSAGFAEDALERGSKDAAHRSFVRQPAAPLFWEAQVVNSAQ